MKACLAFSRPLLSMNRMTFMLILTQESLQSYKGKMEGAMGVLHDKVTIALGIAVCYLVVRVIVAFNAREDEEKAFWASLPWIQPMDRLFASRRAHLESLYGLKQTVAAGYVKVN